MEPINTDIIIDGASIWTTYGALVSSVENDPPEPKTYTVSIPCGVDIDLTSALTGDVAYESRDQSFGLMFIGDSAVSMQRRFSNRIHGRAFDFQLTEDPGYTYRGRFEVENVKVQGRGASAVVTADLSVTADPYKLKEHCMYRLNATGGRWYRFESGRRPVHPVIECENACYVLVDGAEQLVPPGSYRLNDVLFTEGFNRLYVNSRKLFFTTWADFAAKCATWDDAKGMTWDELQVMNSGKADAPRSWGDLSATTWSDLSQTHWYELNFEQQNPEATSVYISYDWEDL